MDRSVLRPYTLFQRRGVKGVGAGTALSHRPSGSDRPPTSLTTPADIAPVDGGDEADFARLRGDLASRRAAIVAAAAAATEAAAAEDGARLRSMAALTRMQRSVRAWLQRRRDHCTVKAAADAEGVAARRARHVAATKIQCVWRHHVAMLHREDARLQSPKRVSAFVALLGARRAKVAARRSREAVAAVAIQRAVRGWIARRYTSAARRGAVRKAAATQAAIRVQAAWKRHVARREFVALRVMHLAASEIQRVFRGWSAARSWARLQTVRRLPPDDRLQAMLAWCEEQHGRVQAAIRRSLAVQEALAREEQHATEAAKFSRRVVGRLAASQARLQDAETCWAWLTWLQGDVRVLAAVAARMVATIAAASTLHTASVPVASAWYTAVWDAAKAANSMTVGYSFATAGMLMLRRANAPARARRSSASFADSRSCGAGTVSTARSAGAASTASKPTPLVAPPPVLSPSAKATVMFHLSAAFASVKDKVGTWRMGGWMMEHPSPPHDADEMVGMTCSVAHARPWASV
jgi:hypothetical protein